MPRHPALTVGCLESRTTPAVTAVLANGHLTITGDSAGDAITLTGLAERIDVAANSVPVASFVKNQVLDVAVLAGGGNDTISLVETVPFTDTRLTTLDGQDGDDTVGGGVGVR